MTWRLFYSYSHQDSILRDKLGAFLALLRYKLLPMSPVWTGLHPMCETRNW
jgi:hypothetical protein